MPPRKNQNETKTETKSETPEVKNETKSSQKGNTKKTKAPAEKKTKAPAEKKTKAPVEKKPKVKPDRESVCAEMKDVVESVQTEITRIRTEKPKTLNTKFLYDLRNQLTAVQKRLLVVLKCKTKRNVNKNSGFGRQMQVSKALSDFLGKSNSELVSRVDASQAINKYIKEHNLYDKTAKVVKADKKLEQLLGVKQFPFLGQFQKLLTQHFTQTTASSKK